MACVEEKKESLEDPNETESKTTVAMTSPEKPRRNLTNDFALCLEKAAVEASSLTQSSTIKASNSSQGESSQPSIFSPKSVIAGIQPPKVEVKSSAALTSYHFHMHSSLKRDLSQALVNRVSFYGIIHDINKEASAMAANDPKEPHVAAVLEESKEESSCALVKAAVGTPHTNGTDETPSPNDSPLPSALVDEEAWLLEIVEHRDPEERTTTTCPPTFLQAIGEREYENPVQALSGASRTQLWKPSRSWWEAKSGKNPWIEPSSHNKRWRYLWPLIHYHKFLAKCIKKLKRNGVDVKQAVSPVAVFLRDEVCAVSDHLAEYSRFDSDKWMACLQYFHGWTGMTSEEELRKRVRQLKLRSLHEPGDVESKLLRDQVDRQFLRAMAQARAELRDANDPSTTAYSTVRTRGQPPVYPRNGARGEAAPVPSHIHGSQNGNGNRRGRYPSQNPPDHYGSHPSHQSPYWGWDQHSMVSPYGDNSSVHSGLSVDSGYAAPTYPMYMHPMAGYHPQYYADPMAYHAAIASQQQYKHDENTVTQTQNWVDPMSYNGHLFHPHQTPMAPPYHATPVDVSENEDVSEGADSDLPILASVPSPQGNFQPPGQQHSPLWSHLDSVAGGLATPGKSSPGTPCRGTSGEGYDTEGVGYGPGAQPPLLRGYPHYGHYGARDGYAPPSPATQFMMSTQPNFAPYGYSYAQSPGGTGKSPRKKKSPVAHIKNNSQHLTPPPSVHKVAATNSTLGESPTTVGTTTETESLPEGTV